MHDLDLPCSQSPEIQGLMRGAVPCARCGSSNLIPVSDCEDPPILAVACDDCGEIEGDATSLPEAVANWSKRYCRS